MKNLPSLHVALHALPWVLRYLFNYTLWRQEEIGDRVDAEQYLIVREQDAALCAYRLELAGFQLEPNIDYLDQLIGRRDLPFIPLPARTGGGYQFANM